ncbi:beta-galactosidase [Paenibacillus piri]|uniref:beta-galactosidase n=1 Tax=Paenibacillus piri TaxID=2547395 RepID=A0A4R5KX98_9BACL|nr:beta-galactosidase [Paenibacillus piri]TDG00682.1 beta-galactosidase [Paenibacillus piri]
MTTGRTLPQLPYGAVYFRKSNPPRDDWERDYAIAQEDGMNFNRHWFMWGAIEVAPGVYDWEDYDRQMDLATGHGIQTIIAEMITSVPEWAAEAYSHAVHVKADGTALRTQMGVSSATGGFGEGSQGVLCLDCAEVKEAAGRFLRELVLRYKDHPATAGYDIWNECNYSPHVCHCRYTNAKFRSWLQTKYGGLQALNRAWNRYSYTSWEQVRSPRQTGPYPECIDWVQFTKDNFYEHMQWRVELIRSLDDRNLIAAHGIAGSIGAMASMGADDWLAASKVDVYGFTWVASRKGSEPWKQWHAVDLTRAASRGKTFWHAEAQGGPLWLQPQVIGRPKEDGRVTEPEDMRVWQMISFAGGARGLLFPRWRPLLDGPLFGAFGPYAMDGSRTDRSAMAGAIAKWANDPEQRKLLEAVPVQGDIGILVVPETQIFDYLLNREGKLELYTQAMWGAYRCFFDQGVQADWVHIDDIAKYRVLYWPYPIMLGSVYAEALKQWVAAGGTLISEGCPAYFGDRGSAGAKQPNHGFDAVFGAVEADVEFMPDRADGIAFDFDESGLLAVGGGFRQSYRPAGGIPWGQYRQDGGTAVVEHKYGQGRTLLAGTFPSIGYFQSGSPSNKAFIAKALAWAGITPYMRLSDASVQARFSRHADGSLFVWVVNPDRSQKSLEIRFSDALQPGQSRAGRVYWDGGTFMQEGSALHVTVRGRDALVLGMDGTPD